nr:probable serine/threonine-protein kinase At1g54610 [Ipomoea batatas]GME18339.1 probable serine/threonine-protein kinase At1g54610 [Ipomoea batatas]
MGCVQAKPSKTSSPPQGLEKLKLQNGYVTARRSTGQRHFSEELRGPGPSRPEPRTRIIDNYVSSRRSSAGSRAAGGERKLIGVEVEGENPKNGSIGVANSRPIAREEELVDGWPKWLVDNIPREVLAGLVPKSADSFDKIDKIGSGTYSNVYKARDRKTGKIVALKKVRFDTSEPESIKFMAREILILQKLDHPNIIKLEGLATSRMQFSLYLVFEYAQCDLSSIISRPDGRLTEPQVKCYMLQLLCGLQHCHERGILHRDIKGSNLLIDKDGMLKIADFGLANFFNPAKPRPLTNRVVTLWYRAPELLLGATEYGAGIDLWSAGCLMAEMFAGRPIMPGRTEVEQLHKIFKLCGTPSNDYWAKTRILTTFRPPYAYKSNMTDAFRHFPASSLGLLFVLLALDPAHRGTAASALKNQFFHTSPLACDLSELPVICKEHPEAEFKYERRRQKASRQRSQSQKERSSKGDSGGSNEEAAGGKYTDSTVFTQEPGSSSTTTSTSSSSKPIWKEDRPPPIPSPVMKNRRSSPRSGAHPTAAKNIKNRPPIPNGKNMPHMYRGNHAYRLSHVQRSVSTREFRNMDHKNQLSSYALED